MLGGENKSQPLGYTITEVMIVLAVSGLMFLMAANFISGRQGQTAFTQGTNEMASQIQSIIEQVSDGHYSDIPLNCTFSPGPPNPDTNAARVPAPGAEQGQNAPCVFLGKVIFMSQAAPTSYSIYSMAGGRITPTSNDPVTALLQADPVSIDQLVVNQDIPQSLEIHSIKSTESDGTVHNYTGAWGTNALGFFQSQGDVSGGAINSGTQTISLIQTIGATDAHNQYALTNTIRELRSSDICLTDGHRYAEILVGTDSTGTSSNPLTVNVRMDDTTVC